MKKQFFSQSMLDSMVDAGKIKVEKGVLTMLAADNPTFDLLPAYRFVRTIDNGPDPAGLVGQIHAEQELKEMGAEVYMDSIIYQDVAYQADPGFIALRQAPGGKETGAPAPSQPAAKPGAPAAGTSPGPDDLSQFILDTLLK